MTEWRQRERRLGQDRLGSKSTWAGLACLLVLVALGCPDQGRPTDAEAPRARAPEFVLPTLDGTEIRLSSLRGRIVIIDFWATWCPPCEVQMPILDALWRDEGERRARGEEPGPEVVVIGLSVDTLPAQEVEVWVEERGLGYPIALGDQQLARAFGVIGFPTLVVVDPEGRIHTRHVGVLSRPELDEILAELRREARSDGALSSRSPLSSPFRSRTKAPRSLDPSGGSARGVPCRADESRSRPRRAAASSEASTTAISSSTKETRARRSS